MAITPTVAAAAAVAGGALSAAGTLAGGANAAQTGAMKQTAQQFAAQQDVQNSASDIAAAQRQGIDVKQKANLVASTARANAAASGVDASTGSAATNQAQIGARGEYESLMDLWQGQNRASGDLNKAAAATYQGQIDELSGQAQQTASYLSAGGTLAASGASAYKIYNTPTS
jgi:hypothetical protein